MTMPTPRRSAAETIGVVLTWIGGGISVVLLGVAALVAFLAWYVVGNGIDVGSGRFACRDQACLDMWTNVLVIDVGLAALIVILIILAIRSSTRSLLAAAVIGSAVAIVLGCLMLVMWPDDDLRGVAFTLLLFAAGPAPLALGSGMRLWARTPSADRGQGGRRGWPA
jgi:hypothetical protein